MKKIGFLLAMSSSLVIFVSKVTAESALSEKTQKTKTEITITPEEFAKIHKNARTEFASELWLFAKSKSEETELIVGEEKRLAYFKLSLLALDYCFKAAQRDYSNVDLTVMLPIRPTGPDSIVFYVDQQPTEQEKRDYAIAAKQLAERRKIQGEANRLSKDVSGFVQLIEADFKRDFTVSEIETQLIPYLEKKRSTYEKLPKGFFSPKTLLRELREYCQSEKNKNNRKEPTRKEQE